MNQPHKEAIEGAAEKRRKYLWNKAVLRSTVIGTSFWMLIGLLATTMGGVMTCVTLFWAFRVPRPVPIAAPVILAPFTGFMAFQTRRYYRFLQQSRRDEEALLYVPPVRDQVISALPAAEILLRGMDAPPASPHELVRAAMSNEATPKTDLLRAADNESSKTE